MDRTRSRQELDPDERWAEIAAARHALAAMLADLTRDEWEHASLCSEWRVKDVAAHVAMTPAGEPTTWEMVTGLIRARGDLWGFGRDVAIAWAQRPTAEIVRTLRTGATSRSVPLGTNAANLLLDVLVHTQDIAVPLGRVHPVPPRAGLVSLRRAWRMGWPFHARKRLTGISLVASDADVVLGSGPPVEAPLGSLLLLTTARDPASVPSLTGPGVALLHR
ncbi:maleylpyruvate isomerase family mycothiol-dependent enzyme [Nocardioides sp. 31GB23]|uniref:maleylpyruvate isomerase family mycothiol-dependent enzyme n=1 Tax=Nocardioides sp. 31GB23 TaxID=3156065 RepID=UPI0032B00D49